MVLPHVAVDKINSRVVVRVRDYELFDYIQDHLVETHDLEPEFYSRSLDEMHFPLSVHREQIVRALQELPCDEVERIWRLNNPSSEAT